MTSDERLKIVHFLFAAAWADGELAKEEGDILATLLSSLSFTSDELRVVEPWFRAAPPAVDWGTLHGDNELREAILRQALVLAGADLTYSIEEVEFLERLRVKAGIENARFQEIWREVETLLVLGRGNG